MKLSIISAVTATFIALTASSASALPIAKPGQMGAEKLTMSEQVQYRKHNAHGGTHGHPGRKHNWRHNHHRYDKYRGWNRYSKRPHNYRNRGCVAVGPVWFCR